MTNDAEHLFMHLLASDATSLLKSAFTYIFSSALSYQTFDEEVNGT